MTMADADAERPDGPPDATSTHDRPASPPAGSQAIAEVQGALSVARGCPFLVAEAGGWRRDEPMRDHRCAAVAPPAALAPEKQARLCLTSSYPTCATYMASVAAREQRLGVAFYAGQDPDRATRWGLTRTTTVIEDSGGLRARVSSVLLDQRRWPAIPAIVLVVTLVVLAFSGLGGVGPTTSQATPSPTAGPTAPPATARPTPAPTTAPTEAPTPMPTSAPTTAPTTAPTSAPSASFQTYRVKSGDTLSAIAAKFGTTVKAIADLNNITDPSKLHVGQVLLIP